MPESTLYPRSGTMNLAPAVERGGGGAGGVTPPSPEPHPLSLLIHGYILWRRRNRYSSLVFPAWLQRWILEPVIWRIFTQSYSLISFVQDVGRTIRKHRVRWQGCRGVEEYILLPVLAQAISKNTCLRGGVYTVWVEKAQGVNNHYPCLRWQMPVLGGRPNEGINKALPSHVILQNFSLPWGVNIY